MPIIPHNKPQKDNASRTRFILVFPGNSGNNIVRSGGILRTDLHCSKEKIRVQGQIIMEKSEIEKHSESGGQQKEIPLCIKCLRPVDPLNYYCPHCGEATGQLTPYIPFVNIPWQAGIWGRMWRQLWSRDISLAGRLFRLFMIMFFVPVMLIGLIPKLWRKSKDV